MANSLKGNEAEVVSEGPDVATVLLAIGSSRVPGPPILLSGQLQFLSQLVDPEDSSRVRYCGVAVAGVNQDLVLIEGDEALVDPV